jgi:predicted DNA-binding transcriptional regulator AlpA
VPIIQFACEKIGIARSSAYRWMDEDDEFKKEVTQALAEGD